MHSLRSWLATLCRQIEVLDRETNEMLDWTNRTMVRCYTRNFNAAATSQRRRIVMVRSGDWRSAGPGKRLRNPPRWKDIQPERIVRV